MSKLKDHDSARERIKIEREYDPQIEALVLQKREAMEALYKRCCHEYYGGFCIWCWMEEPERKEQW